MKRLLLLACLVTLGCGDDDTSRPDAALDAALDDGATSDAGRPSLAMLVEDVARDTGVPSLAVAIVDSRGVVESAASGVRRLGDSTPVTLDDRYHLGSNTKAMTATVAAILVDEGTVAWTTTLEEVFGDEVTVDAGYADVTLAELLSHTAGIDDEAVVARIDELPDEVVAARRAGALAVIAAPPDGARGTFVYSNVGYVIAGAILEKRTETSWESLLRTRLFAPLEMRSCGFGPPGTSGAVDEPWGHAHASDAPRPIDPGAEDADNPPLLGPAGTVHCAIADWAKFAAMNLRGQRGSTDELVSPAGFVELATPRANDYALGWLVLDDPTTLAHDGSNTRFYSIAILVPSGDRGLLVNTNVGGARAEAALEAVIAWSTAP
ncbi:MAG: beta-lactamase family protein [Sandaracinus sp.]|nr:beta-lactamase family protein [Sandaracinus sp.]MCB9633454.1 beta-lactamase family protein [Sandaracinus sp.]